MGDQDDPNWQEKELDLKTKRLWQESIDNYIFFHSGTKIEHLKPGIDLVKKLIPFVGMKDPRWRKFDVEKY